MNSEHPDSPAPDFLSQLFTQIPVLVLRLTPEGLILAANPEVARVTGYPCSDLVGRNVWGLLFPGKLFQQVPKFLVPLRAGSPLRDCPMTLRTRDGADCAVTWSGVPCGGTDGTVREIICTGIDLTQRLSAAAPTTVPDISVAPVNANTVYPANQQIEGDFVAPLAITPPARGPQNAKAIQETQDLLHLVEQRGGALHTLLCSIPCAPATATATDPAVGTLLRLGGLHADTLGAGIKQVQADSAALANLCHRSPPPATTGGRPG